MAVVNEYLEPVMTTITQSVQFRVFRKVSADAYRDWRANFGETQSVFEFDMRRRDILSSKAGGLHRVGPEEAAYQLIGGLHGPRSARLRGSVVLSTCVRCHSGNGIFSVNSYTRHIGPRAINPQLLPADSVDYQGRTALEWKKQRFDWGLLRGLLERGR